MKKLLRKGFNRIFREERKKPTETKETKKRLLEIAKKRKVHEKRLATIEKINMSGIKKLAREDDQELSDEQLKEFNAFWEKYSFIAPPFSQTCKR